jgi:trehalose 6-phosphate phosphatase
MQVLKPGFNIDEYFRLLAKAPKKALLLDYDGTLAPFRVERDKAYPYPGVREILDELLDNPACRVVIISGRWIEDLLPLLSLKRVPEIWGSHGWERLLPNGLYKAHEMDEKYIKGLANVDDWAVKEGLQNRYERKPGCLALHWRGMEANEIEAIRHKAMNHWRTITAETGLEIHEFNGGLELRAPGKNKGDAIKTIISEMGNGMVAYLGDDLTDEDAFAALNNNGLSVLVSKESRTTAADIRITPPDELLDFLSRWGMAVGA